MSPELQEAVDAVGLHLASKDWRDRSDALRALGALLPALPEVREVVRREWQRKRVPTVHSAQISCTTASIQATTDRLKQTGQWTKK